jgi:hypothetical protein
MRKVQGEYDTRSRKLLRIGSRVYERGIGGSRLFVCKVRRPIATCVKLIMKET